jgi:hypothetical protein
VTDDVGSTGLTILSFTSSTVTFILPTGNSKGTKIIFALNGIRNPRSFKPSDNFIISTLDQDGFTIDEGLDTFAVMDEMNSFNDIQITSHNKTNGHLSKYNITINSLIEIRDGDKLVFTIPEIMSIPQEVSCIPGA